MMAAGVCVCVQGEDVGKSAAVGGVYPGKNNQEVRHMHA